VLIGQDRGGTPRLPAQWTEHGKRLLIPRQGDPISITQAALGAEIQVS